MYSAVSQVDIILTNNMTKSPGKKQHMMALGPTRVRLNDVNAHIFAHTVIKAIVFKKFWTILENEEHECAWGRVTSQYYMVL